MKKAVPLIQIRCDCGAVWSGRNAARNTVIDSHRERERDGHKLGCKVHDAEPWTPPVSAYVPKKDRYHG